MPDKIGIIALFDEILGKLPYIKVVRNKVINM